MALKLITKETVFEIVVQGVKFFVQPLSNKEMDMLRKRHTKIVRGVEVTDTSAMYYDRFDMTLKGWEDGMLQDANDVPMVCDSATKRIIADRNAKLAIEILTMTDELDGEAKEAAAKN